MALTVGSLGFIAVPTPGTRVQVSATKLTCKYVRFQPRLNNTTVNVGNTYIYGQQTGGSAFAILSPEQVQPEEIVPVGNSDLDLSAFWIDADNANDAMLVSYLQ
jgi:hypothetical protein